MNEQMWSRFFELAAQGRGLNPVARFFMEQTGYPLILCDATLRILAIAIPLDTDHNLAGYLPPSVLDNHYAEGNSYYGTVSIDTEEVPFRMLSIGEGNIWGYAFQLNATPDTEIGREELRAASLAALVELTRLKLEQDTERRYRNEFLQDILYNNIPNREAVYNRGLLWGWDLSQPHMALVATAGKPDEDGGRDDSNERWQQLAANYLSQQEPRIIIADRSDQLILLLPLANTEPGPNKARAVTLINRLRQHLGERIPGYSFSIGAGRLYRSVSELYRAYQEAKVALEINRLLQKTEQLVFFDELGAVRLIYNQGEKDLSEYYEEVLGPLERHDQEHSTTLIETLAAYLQTSGDPVKAAEKLFVHANTLRYRLKKIEELLNQDVRRLDVQANLYIAFQVKTILSTLTGSK